MYVCSSVAVWAHYFAIPFFSMHLMIQYNMLYVGEFILQASLVAPYKNIGFIV